mgnify:FL=1
MLLDNIELPDKFINQDTPYKMYSTAKMNGLDIANRVIKKLKLS